jgi:hypothetical protein
MSMLSEETRLAQDRSALRNIQSDLSFKIEDHPAYRWPPPANAKQAPPHPFEATSAETSVLLCISSASLAKLKS